MLTKLDLDTALEMGSDRWDRLALSHEFPSVFTSWAWHWGWLQGSSSTEREAAIVLTDFSPSNPRPPSVIAPFALRKGKFRRVPVRTLAWCASNVGTPDHLDLLSLDGETDHSELAAAILTLRWDVLILSNLEEQFPRTRRLLTALKERGCSFDTDSLWACAQIHLPGTWEEYLQQLSGKQRYRIRKDERVLRTRHKVETTDYGFERFDEGWSHLVRLHEARWKGKGSFQDRRLSGVFRHFAQALAEQGRLGLFSLDIDGDVAAIDFWAEFGGTAFGIQSGYDPKWADSSVARVLRGLGIQRAISSGLRVVDFSRRVEGYKSSWCPQSRWCKEARVFRDNWPGRLLRGWNATVIKMRKLGGAIGSSRMRLGRR